MTFLSLFAAITLTIFPFQAALFFVGRFLGLTISEVSLFVGPKLISTHLGGIPFCVRAIPFGGGVEFDRRERDGVGFFKKSALIFSSAAAQFALAVLLLGFAAAVESATLGFSQVLAPVLPELSTNALVAQAFEFASNAPFTAIVGAAAAKSCAMNLLPLPPLNGGHFVMSLFKLIAPVSERTEMYIVMLGFLLCVAIQLRWFYLVLRFAWAGQ